MHALITLSIIIWIYYVLYRREFYVFTTKNHLYFAGFVIIYLIIYYLMKYQKTFIYKLFSNMKHTENIKVQDLHNLSVRKEPTKVQGYDQSFDNKNTESLIYSICLDFFSFNYMISKSCYFYLFFICLN